MTEQIRQELTVLTARVVDLEKGHIAMNQTIAIGNVHQENIMGRLSSIEDTLKWLVRLIIGGLVMAAVAYGLQGGFTL